MTPVIVLLHDKSQQTEAATKCESDGHIHQHTYYVPTSYLIHDSNFVSFISSLQSQQLISSFITLSSNIKNPTSALVAEVVDDNLIYFS